MTMPRWLRVGRSWVNLPSRVVLPIRGVADHASTNFWKPVGNALKVEEASSIDDVRHRSEAKEREAMRSRYDYYGAVLVRTTNRHTQTYFDSELER